MSHKKASTATLAPLRAKNSAPATTSSLTTTPAPVDTEPHSAVHSPAFDQENERMKHAAKPNDGEPLSHRNRGKAGRKG